jgi:integrase
VSYDLFERLAIRELGKRKAEKITTAEIQRLHNKNAGCSTRWDATNPKAKHAPKESNRRTVIGPHAAAALRLLIFTGARLREILHLKWKHVDFERGLLLLPTSKTGKKPPS